MRLHWWQRSSSRRRRQRSLNAVTCAAYVLGCGLRNLSQVIVGGAQVWSKDTVDPARLQADWELTERMIASAEQSGIHPVRLGVRATS